MLHAWNMRSLKESIFAMKSHNKLLIGSICAAFCLMALILFIPALRGIFSLTSLSGLNYLWAVLIAAAIVPIVETVKAAQRAKS